MLTSSTAQLEARTPQTYKAAMMGVDRKHWEAAMEAEVGGCKAQQTWTLVKRSELPRGANVIPVKWVFKIKTDENGKISKYKARITPKGFKQRHGVDFFEVFAHTGKYKTLRVLLSLAAEHDMELRQLDVPQAFTRAKLDEEVYMEMPEGFSVSGMVCRLQKSLYGLKQSPRNWYLLVSKFIKEQCGFKACVSDPCLFHKRSRSGKAMWIFLFVDDMQAAHDRTDAAEWSEVQQQLRAKFDVTDLGESKWMLGMRITRDRAAKTIRLDQELYINTALEKFGMKECKTARSPAAQNHGAQEDDRDGGGKPANVKLYQEKVGTLLYAAISTRPDISYAVQKLTQQMQAPKLRHMHACDRVFRYLAGTRTQGLLFGRREGSSAAGPSVSAYADADWAGDKTDRKSITGWIAKVNGDPVSWASKKQSVVSLSTCEAELYAEAAAVQELLWLRGLLKEIGQPVRGPSLLYGDNQSTVKVSENGVRSERTKHVDIKYHFVTDVLERGDVKLQWIPTGKQQADVLTKALAAPQHALLRDNITTRCN
jgi:hypothetical protein